jgi:hypothetical protein
MEVHSRRHSEPSEWPKEEAAEDLQTERIKQVKYGSALEPDLIESRAQSLQAKQDLLTAQLQ